MKEYRLNELFDLKHGYAFKSEYFSDKGKYVVTSPGHFYEKGGFRTREGKEKRYIGDFDESWLLSKNDLIIAMTEQGEGLLGSTARIPENSKYLHNQRLGLIHSVNIDLTCLDFLYYLMNTQNVRAQISASSSGTKVRHTSPERIGNVKVEIPDLPTQNKIASILSAYDDLIDNNNQRIQLLEDMAAEIYKEWFVRLRFPGYQAVKYFDKEGKEVPQGTVGALPEGWENGKVGDLAEFRKGKVITKSTIKEGNVPVVAGGLTPAYFHNKSNTVSPTITISASGANAGYVNLYYENIWASDCSYLDSQMTDLLYFFFTSLKVRQKEVFHLQKGSAQPHVYPKDILKLKIKTPSKELLFKFEKLVTPFYEEISILKNKNQLLQETRDLLLPRLISGKLSVEEISTAV